MADQKTLQIKKFRMDAIKKRKNIVVIGKRGSGKSILMKDILYHIRKRVDTAFAMSPTHESVKMFESIMPKSHVYDGYSLDTIQNLIAVMASLVSQGKEREVALCTDDCMFEKGIMKTEEMRLIHMNGRHYNIWYINSVQYITDMGPAIRTNVDYVFALKENTIAGKKRLYDFFFGVFPDFKEFCLTFDKCTENHSCLVLDNSTPHSSIEDCIFHYTANPDIGKFRIGRTIYYKLDHLYKREAEQANSDRHKKTKLPDPIKSRNKIKAVEKVSG